MTTIPASRASTATSTSGTSRSTWNFGGGTSSWTIALIVAAGRCVLASTKANRRPERECSRLWTTSPIRSRRESSGVFTARSVCLLMVSGLG